MSVNCGPKLIWVIEPENKHRFRYASEGGSHGGIAGKDGKKSSPTLKLINYTGKKRIRVRVTLYTEDQKEHVLDFKGKKNEGSKHYIEEELQSDNRVVFKNLHILCKKKDEIEKILMERKISNLKEGVSAVARAQLEKMYITDVKARARAILNSARLYFEAFEVDKPGVPLCTLFSGVISNQKAASKGDLRICRLSQCAGSWKGGDEVILLCEKVQKENIKVKFFETEDGEKDGYVLWEDYGQFSPIDVHYQVAIPFKTPRYKRNEERKVFICLERNGEMSDPREFTYKPDGNDFLYSEPLMKKRKTTPISDTSEIQPGHLLFSHHSAPESAESCSSMSVSSPESSLNATHGEMSSSSSFMWDDSIKNDEDLINLLDSNLPFEELDLDNGCDIVTGDTYVGDISEQITNQNFFPVTIENVNVFDSTSANEVIGIEAAMMNLKVKTEIENECHNQNKYTKNESKDSRICLHKLQQEKRIDSRHLLKRDICGNTLLHIAVILNKNIMPILKMTHVMKIDLINVQNHKKQTALHLASEKHRSGTVKILLECGSNPNLKDLDGNTCYHIAARNNFPYVLSELTRFSHFHPEVSVFNDEGLTPMHLAIMQKNPVLFDLLKPHISDYNVIEKKAGKSLLHYAIEFLPSLLPKLLEMSDIDVNIRDFDDNTPLHIACAYGNIEAVKKLLQSGADPFIKNFKQNFNILTVENAKDCEENSDGQLPADLTTDTEILKLLTGASDSPVDNLLKLKTATSFEGSHEKPCEITQRLCKYLDEEMRWQKLSTFFLEDDFVASLTLSSSPAKALLDYVKKTEQENYLERIKTALEFADLIEGVNILNEVNVVNQ